MLTETQINEMKTLTGPENVAVLISEIERLNQYIKDYNTKVTQQLDVIETDMARMEAENGRLISAREVAYLERDACVGLVAALAQKTGLRVGTVAEQTVVVELPSGQVSWNYEESEAHLFSSLPVYPDAIEDLKIDEKYRRVMNPGT